ncbi:rod shape-determining protein MreD [Nocardioides caeni]|uniref:Rod shape-determining protein MreD n=2 Tax=Nocardioides caeni TaxID=574700 RepID=A0A4S8NQL9_9ACTN|nr:rod shape-determining protein MreD [Nocardioides caeni]
MRLLSVTIALVVALLLQVTVLPHFAWRIGGLGVVPDLVLLVVVAVALVTDTRYATLTGFFAGVLTDLAPPADHVAGRGALALMIVGYVIGRLAHDHVAEVGRPDEDVVRRPPLPLVVAAAAGGSFIGTTVFALSGLVLGDSAASVADLLPVVLAALVMDVVAALVVVPVVLALLSRPAGRQRSERTLAGTTRTSRRTLARS